MSALSYNELSSRLSDADPDRRLVVAPILDKTRQLKRSQAGVDVRLGRAFALARPWLHGVAGQLPVDVNASLEPSLEEFVLEYGQPLIVHPHQFVLGRTLEYVRLPADLTAQVIGRSSWGRRGLIVATATVVHPGFAGAVTLELKNVGEVPLAIYPLDCIAQLVFFEVTNPPKQDGLSQFASTFAPTLGNARDPETERRLRSLIARRTATPATEAPAPPAPHSGDSANDDPGTTPGK